LVWGRAHVGVLEMLGSVLMLGLVLVMVMVEEGLVGHVGTRVEVTWIVGQDVLVRRAGFHEGWVLGGLEGARG
jgi:hypothetical protein